MSNAERAELRSKSNVPNLRFPEFKGEWKAEQLSDIAKLTKGVGISKDQLSVSGELCILYGELYTKYDLEIINEVLSKTDIHTDKLIRSKANDVIIPCSGETAVDIASARCVSLDNILLGGDLNIIRLNYYDGSFMSYQLNGKRKYDIAKVAQGVSVVHLYGEHLKGIITYNPKLDEQKKIVRLLSLLDERIATQNKIIEKLQSLIKGLAYDVANSCKNRIARTLMKLEDKLYIE
ncbi:MAG: restriction endonuclease subunit S [Bacteroidales bacterium]|nr:restriction endonuclease subunit S [Bacteroidales bacterium]